VSAADRNELGMPALPGGDVVAPRRCLDGTLGFRVDEIGTDRAVGSFEVTDAVRQRMGLVHGGAYAAFAEMLASEATIADVYPRGMIAVGLSNDSNFLRPVTEGRLTATATQRHSGASTRIWDVSFEDGRGRLCAVSRVTIAVRERPGDRPGPG
jgi:1,4-dihydroxy-2-naphthoyl-CoA hydrolase